MSIRAFCAWIASVRNTGAEYWLINAERARSRGSWRACTSITFCPETTMRTCTGPYLVSMVVPLNVPLSAGVPAAVGTGVTRRDVGVGVREATAAEGVAGGAVRAAWLATAATSTGGTLKVNSPTTPRGGDAGA